MKSPGVWSVILTVLPSFSLKNHHCITILSSFTVYGSDPTCFQDRFSSKDALRNSDATRKMEKQRALAAVAVGIAMAFAQANSCFGCYCFQFLTVTIYLYVSILVFFMKEESSMTASCGLD